MIAIFPGSFDPPTIGHISLIKRSAAIFDKVIVAVAENNNYMFPVDVRLAMLKSCCSYLENVVVTSFTGLMVDCASHYAADVIVKGARSMQDFDYERNMAAANKIIGSNIETFLLPSLPEYSYISSSLAKDILVNNGDLSSFLPSEVIAMLSSNKNGS
jgi:pantetheine-phosphate adenylyltransferase